LLLSRGARVRNLTGHSNRPDPFGGRVEVTPLRFDDPSTLRESLRGVRVLYNTYWVRFDHGASTFARAVERGRTLFRAAVEAGVERVVHVSITNPAADSPLPYFRGKAETEGALRASGLSHAILRPAVFFGGRDVLINNIAWLLRRLPVFGVAPGAYGIQPIHVEDLARLAVAQGEQRRDVVLDAVGPETFEFQELVRLVRDAVGSRSLDRARATLGPRHGLAAPGLGGPGRGPDPRRGQGAHRQPARLEGSTDRPDALHGLALRERKPAAREMGVGAAEALRVTPVQQVAMGQFSLFLIEVTRNRSVLGRGGPRLGHFFSPPPVPPTRCWARASSKVLKATILAPGRSAVGRTARACSLVSISTMIQAACTPSLQPQSACVK
jgi:uncharacterized protein YbjT (DUF2867 family)